MFQETLSWYKHEMDRKLLTSTTLPKWTFDEMNQSYQMPWINMGYRRVNINGFYHFVPYREKVYPDGRVEDAK
jgi:hypothetical protein